jgi:hypothetical protein
MQVVENSMHDPNRRGGVRRRRGDWDQRKFVETWKNLVFFRLRCTCCERLTESKTAGIELKFTDFETKTGLDDRVWLSRRQWTRGCDESSLGLFCSIFYCVLGFKHFGMDMSYG